MVKRDDELKFELERLKAVARELDVREPAGEYASLQVGTEQILDTVEGQG